MNKFLKILFVLILILASCKVERSLPVVESQAENTAIYRTKIAASNYNSTSYETTREKEVTSAFAGTFLKKENVKLTTIQKVELAAARHIIKSRLRKKLKLASASRSGSSTSSTTGYDLSQNWVLILLALLLCLLIIIGAIVLVVWLFSLLFGTVFHLGKVFSTVALVILGLLVLGVLVDLISSIGFLNKM